MTPEHVAKALNRVQPVIVASSDRGDARPFGDSAIDAAVGQGLRRKLIWITPFAPGWSSIELEQMHPADASLRSGAAGFPP
jgi:hypothetical protein